MGDDQKRKKKNETRSCKVVNQYADSDGLHIWIFELQTGPEFTEHAQIQTQLAKISFPCNPHTVNFYTKEKMGISNLHPIYT